MPEDSTMDKHNPRITINKAPWQVAEEPLAAADMDVTVELFGWRYVKNGTEKSVDSVELYAEDDGQYFLVMSVHPAWLANMEFSVRMFREWIQENRT